MLENWQTLTVHVESQQSYPYFYWLSPAAQTQAGPLTVRQKSLPSVDRNAKEDMNMILILSYINRCSCRNVSEVRCIQQVYLRELLGPDRDQQQDQDSPGESEHKHVAATDLQNIKNTCQMWSVETLAYSTLPAVWHKDSPCSFCK